MLFPTNRFLLISVNVMAFDVVWHPSASVDLEEVMGYVCQNFGRAALKELYDKIMERMEVLSSFPSHGVRYAGVSYQGNEVRIIYIRQNAIVYSFDGKQITVLVFWDNRRNPVCLEKLIVSR